MPWNAAAMAGARELARQGATTNASVLSQARRYASANHVHPEDLEVYAATWMATSSPSTTTASPHRPKWTEGVVGVLVRGRGRVPASGPPSGVRSSAPRDLDGMGLLWGLLGRRPVPGGNLLDTFASHGGEPRSARPTPSGGQDCPGQLRLGVLERHPGHTSNPTLVDNIRNPSNSGEWHVGDWIFAGPGVQNSSQVAAAIQELIDTGKNEVTLPSIAPSRGRAPTSSTRSPGSSVWNWLGSTSKARTSG